MFNLDIIQFEGFIILAWISAGDLSFGLGVFEVEVGELLVDLVETLFEHVDRAESVDGVIVRSRFIVRIGLALVDGVAFGSLALSLLDRSGSSLASDGVKFLLGEGLSIIRLALPSFL